MAKTGTPVNETEAFAISVCQKTFLSLWCYNNPIAKPGKELCDILVVCGPHVIISSVKDVRLREGNFEVEHNRWERRAIEESVKQIYGAERRLSVATQVIQADGLPGLPLPPLAQRKVHRIAVAFGGRDQVVITSGDFGKGFVHVLTERSFLEVLRELDTITDLVDYLSAKEALLGQMLRGCRGLGGQLGRPLFITKSIIPERCGSSDCRRHHMEGAEGGAGV
jgi:hypothetical protein